MIVTGRTCEVTTMGENRPFILQVMSILFQFTIFNIENKAVINGETVQIYITRIQFFG